MWILVASNSVAEYEMLLKLKSQACRPLVIRQEGKVSEYWTTVRLRYLSSFEIRGLHLGSRRDVRPCSILSSLRKAAVVQSSSFAVHGRIVCIVPGSQVFVPYGDVARRQCRIIVWHIVILDVCGITR